MTLIVKCSHLGCGQVDQASASLTHCLPENSWPKWHHVIDLMFGTHHVISPEISEHVEMSLAFSVPNPSRGYYPMLLHYLRSLKFWNKPGVSFEIELESFIHVWISDRIRKTWECRVKSKNLIQNVVIVPLKRVQVQSYSATMSMHFTHLLAFLIASPPLHLLRRHQWRGSHKNV